MSSPVSTIWCLKTSGGPTSTLLLQRSGMICDPLMGCHRRKSHQILQTCPQMLLGQQFGWEMARRRGGWWWGGWWPLLVLQTTAWPQPEGKLKEGSQQISEDLGWFGSNLWDLESWVWGDQLKASVPAVLLGQRQHGLRGFVTAEYFTIS